MDYIKIEGSMVLPAKVEGSSDVFQSPHFTLVKPTWVPDESSTYCELCTMKFNQIKRRHHCRVCGAIRCGKCCNAKISLPHLGMEEEERVCESCRTVTELVSKGKSPDDTLRAESANGLSTFSKHDKHIKKLVELGGVQTLITLSLTDKVSILTHVASGIHSLTTHYDLHKFLADAGAIKAVCKILSTISDSNEQIAIDGISSLMIFCKSSNLKTKALTDGGLQPVLSLSWSENEAISLLSLNTLSLIAEHPGTHNAIFDNKHRAVARLLQLLSSDDEQMQEVSLKILCYLSMGSMEHKHSLVQEDFSNGRCIHLAFEAQHHNPQVLCNAACLVGNLATSPEDQTGLQDLLVSTCRKLPNSENNTELMCHLTRTLANFAQHKQNTARLMNELPNIVSYCLRSSVAPIQSQGMKILLTLLGQAPARVASLLTGDGAHTFITNLGVLPGFSEAALSCFSNDAQDIAKPL